MIDIINIDKNVLILNEISVGEYLWLEQMHKNGSISVQDVGVIGNIDIFSLEKKGFLKIIIGGVSIRQKTRELFEVPIDNFHRFLNTFPIKTPKGRYLSPKNLEGVAVTALKKKWKNLFKENKSTEDHVISVLEAEVAWRKKGGELEYMTAVEAWLNGGFWEKYEHLLEDKVNVQAANNNELM